jgi:hypothetical protein
VDPNKEHPPTNLFEAGLGFISSGGSACQVRVKGESEPRPPPHDFDRLVPGDAFVTKEQGGVRVFAFNTINTEITMDAQTALRLEQETKDASVWWLEQGRIHVSTNFGVLDASDRAPIIKAAFQTVEADVGSEYDIVVDDRGAVSVKVYRGNVRTRENFADRILMDNLEQFLNQRSNKKSPPQWWEPKGIP